jgi:predicted metal-dependent hydrolase
MNLAINPVSAPPKLRVRAPKLSFAGLPRYWLGGNRGATHLANAVNLLFPAGERFFVRSVRHYEKRVSPELASTLKGFYGQEGRHAQAHERLFATLREQGYPIDRLLKRYTALAYGFFERISPPGLRLAVTVALEHFTAILAEATLVERDLENASPALRQLLEWHAVEELEHKAVAFDVMAEVKPSYLLRVVGMLVGATMLGGFWLWFMRQLCRHDGSSLREAGADLDAARDDARAAGKRADSIARGVFWNGIREYLRPGFHPNQRDDRKLIADSLERLAAEGVVEAAQVTRDSGDGAAELS